MTPPEGPADPDGDGGQGLDRLTAQRFLRVAWMRPGRAWSRGAFPSGPPSSTATEVSSVVVTTAGTQDDDASCHAETAAFRQAGRRRHYRDCVMVTTLSPCWYCSGLVRQFGIGAVVIGESRNFTGGKAWLADVAVTVLDLDDGRCIEMLARFIEEQPELWNEDIGR